MYKYTRQEVANLLRISSRSVDRYIKSWKLRAKKEWKIVYINAEDVDNLKWWKKKQEILTVKKSKFKPINGKEESINQETQEIIVKKHSNVDEIYENLTLDEKIYVDLKKEIKEKDTIITELSIRLGSAEEIAKNSVSLIDYKKSQFLLEESKSNLNQAIIDLESDKEQLEKKINYQKVNNVILLVALIFVFGIAFALFWLNI